VAHRTSRFIIVFEFGKNFRSSFVGEDFSLLDVFVANLADKNFTSPAGKCASLEEHQSEALAHMPAEPFSIHVPDAVLADLTRRLDATRWPDEIEGAAWDLGVNQAYMRSLAEYWRNAYDWRRQEAKLNQLPQYRIAIDGLHIHFVHVRGKGPAPLPLIITHGWPGSFIEMTKLIPLLTDPAAHGGTAEDAFDVIVPSLPGYGFSDRPRERGMNPQKIAGLWTRLMQELGYQRFAAQGGDWGSAVSIALGLDHPERLIGIHLNYIAGRFLLGGTINQPPEDEIAAAYLEQARAWWDAEGGYSHEQGTKPQTLSYSLNDSPVGLAAWIIEKFRTWSDCGDEVEGVFSRDELLTNVMIYWVTETAHSSARLYYESRLRPLSLSHTNYVKPPVAFAAFPKEIPLPPRQLAERGLNITRWTEMPKGGHFAAMEQPELLAGDLREFFHAFR
jgi:pimeloyl-ACP methyl ester carboxylesterase